ncbi:MAG TPA: Stp1/IreP family PP2C-type Ser/Thr phosphatase [Ktedonobacterales bacterium]|nr:Stp1/IreP family PP2C-type Ser/Thr phosphatase [Ktedonobacterales bacterium]
MLAKTLRLEAAQLTDVGRRRERNQDNIAHLIPADSQVLDEKGALFVVCDGMGGHAAGEVASELGVRTICKEYYDTRGTDVITALATAVERANTAIYQHAIEHPELSGMGTTCVALVIAGGRVFVVNIGDSRAYIIRHGKMRQVTRDHSWVAEQVRVGLLTEEQARTHSHRNVITRSLGTQPNVTADLFVETMHNGDRVLICSDGLHGYVDESDIERTVTGDSTPDVAVQTLIDMANDNGGPDNISALLVHLIDVPAPVGELMLPDSAIPAEGITQPLPAVGVRAAAKSDHSSKAPKEANAPKVHERSQPRRRASGREVLMVNALRALVAVLIVALVGGFWYFAFGPYGQQQAANQQLRNDVTLAQQTIKHASTQDPATALSSLAHARDQLMRDLANPNLASDFRSSGYDVLARQLQPAVQQTIQRYNATALLTPVNIATAQLYRLSCQGSGSSPTALTTVTQLVAMHPAGASSQMLYALNDGHLYQIVIPVAGGLPQSGASCQQITLSGVATIVALAGDGATLNILAEQPSGQYLVAMMTASGTNSDGTPKTAVVNRFNVATKGGETPQLIVSSGADVYISYTSKSPGAFGVWHYSSPLPATSSAKDTKTTSTSAPKPPTGPAQTMLLQRPPVSLAYSHGVLYMLDSAGGLGQIDSAKKYTFSALPVQIPSPLQPALPDDYTVATPVPTPEPTSTSNVAQSPSGALSASVPQAAAVATATATSAATATAIPATPSVTSGTIFGDTGTLAIDPGSPAHLLICDATQSRLVRLVASASGPGLGFAAQYAYDAPLQGATQLAVSSAGSQLVVYTWANGVLAAYTVPETSAGA